MGRRESNPFVPTGVELSMTIHSSVPGEIKAVTTQEIEAKQHQEEAKKHQEEEATAKKKREEEERAKSKPPTRAQLLAHALRECQKQPKKRRARCVASAHKQYGPRVTSSKEDRGTQLHAVAQTGRVAAAS